MKYVLIVFIFSFFPHVPFAQDLGSQSGSENCAYATQTIHTVSEAPYRNLLARLKGKNTKARPERRTDESTGQR